MRLLRLKSWRLGVGAGTLAALVGAATLGPGSAASAFGPGSVRALGPGSPRALGLGSARALQDQDEVVQTLYDLVDRDPFVQRRAARALWQRREPDCIPFMVAALRYEPFRNETLVEILIALSGRDFGNAWEPWTEWVVREDIETHPVYRQWKAALLARLNPRFGVFLDAQRRSTIDYREIHWGGVAPEGIPSLDNPAVVGAADVDYLEDEELVFGVALAPDDGTLHARAYPLRILDWHEMTNDVVAGIPVALSYCTLCGSGILFDRRIGYRTYSFATSGLLYRSNKLMFDRETETLWSNLTGTPVLGDLVGEGIELKVLPLVVTTWADWKGSYPDTTVLSLDTGHVRDYTPGRPYGAYFASPDTMFPVAARDERLPAKAWVFGLRVGGEAAAFALEALQQSGVLNTAVGGEPVVLVAGEGRAVRAFARRDLTFDRQPGGGGGGASTSLIGDDGTTWRVTDLALVQDGGGGRLRRLPGHLAYWFGWYAFFPETRLWNGE